jgi:hypothetical protein
MLTFLRLLIGAAQIRQESFNARNTLALLTFTKL